MIRTTLVGLVCAVLVAAVPADEADGAGMLIPKSESVPPLAVKFLRVDTTIDNQVATTRVVQEFKNSTSRNLECTYIFPLPKGASIRDFAMYIDGKRVKGGLLKKEKAREIYETIVRRMKDPALLEYMDSQLLRLRIFPVPAQGTRKIELEYTELVPVDNGLAEYVFPLRTGAQASRTLDDFTVRVRIKNRTPIKSVYSPTHGVGISRPSDYEAIVGMESKAALLANDFQLFYTLSEKEFGLNLMTYRPDPELPGMFLLLISPKTEIEDKQRVPRDVAFVFDTSGSMMGEKVEQAKAALDVCIAALDSKDRFAIVQFSTAALTFADGWTQASKENKEKAANWVGAFEASGGTNISEALEAVLALPVDAGRPATIMFLTDGCPTVGTTDVPSLMKMVKDKNKRNLRIFSFGVGNDVNTHLLDMMSDTTGGLPEYIRPGQTIDAKVTRLFAKMSHPVLTNLEIKIPGVKVLETYPKQLPDLFRGSQVVVVGEYTSAGDSAIRLTGFVGKKKKEYVYEAKFPKKDVKRSFIASIYAHRKIGFLLDEIRLHGENKELKDEVVRLSLAYGVETPYTSYLVLESKEQWQQFGVALNRTKLLGSARGSRPKLLSRLEPASVEKALRLNSRKSKSAAGTDFDRAEGVYGRAYGEGAA
ncbi:MAG: VIT domain-containing protein, partial [Planctomycetia bacterium]|nr:VIT domain-containing protein [Planctomycetia bacterium]